MLNTLTRFEKTAQKVSVHIAYFPYLLIDYVSLSAFFLFHPSSYLHSSPLELADITTCHFQAAMDTAIDRIRREVKVLHFLKWYICPCQIALNFHPLTSPHLQSQKQKSDAMCELKTAHDWQAEKEVGLSVKIKTRKCGFKNLKLVKIKTRNFGFKNLNAGQSGGPGQPIVLLASSHSYSSAGTNWLSCLHFTYR